MTISSFEGRWAFLSNFYPVVIEHDGIKYPSLEHAYQAMKTLDHVTRLRISREPTAAGAKARGNRLPPILKRSEWPEIKVNVMLVLLRMKFFREGLAQQLMDTMPHDLVEGNDWNDTFWGVCHGQGENQLGKLLMQVRMELISRNRRTIVQ